MAFARSFGGRWGAGIPILDTSVNTPPGQITWQDLVMLKWDVPMQWHGEGTYVMNQRTWALLATMTDAIGRPLFTPSPIQDQPGFLLNGSPVTIVTQMPNRRRAAPFVVGNWPWRRVRRVKTRRCSRVFPRLCERVRIGRRVEVPQTGCFRGFRASSRSCLQRPSGANRDW